MIRSLLLLVCAFGHLARGATPTLAFHRGEQVMVAGADGSGVRKTVKGVDAMISPDGKWVAFTHYTVGGKSDGARHIAVADVSSGAVQVFKKDIPSDNSHRPVWTPDSARILFHTYADNDWHVAEVDAKGGAFRYVKKAGPNHNSYWSVACAADGKSFYAQDLLWLYQFDLTGKELNKWKVDALFPGGSLNSGSHFAVSPNGLALLADVEMDEPVDIDDWGGGAPSIWKVDLNAMKAARITPVGEFSGHGCWLSDDEIAYSSFTVKQRHPALYRRLLGAKQGSVLLKNGDSPSAAR